MALIRGTRLGPYEVLSTLGAGGMGEVYEAADTRLERRVALKLLPAAIASDADRRARFEKEARAVASLSHPGIVTIYSVEEYDGTRFLTMELVDGRTLDRLIPPTGLPLEQLLTYAIPLVEAVAAAHAHHLVHRDLKPANVMVTRDGRVKVLDFGLAKLLAPPAPDQGDVETVAAPPATIVGQIVGTVAYMSPEQAEGRPVDHRSDIFALGVLLYEMATAVRPFRGDTHLSVLSSIIKDDPTPITRLRPGASPHLERIVTHCLAKDREQRPSSAADLRSQLAGLTEAAVPPTRRLPRWARPAIAVSLIGLAAYGTATWTFRVRDVPMAAPTFVRLTDDRGSESWPSLSADGVELVYVAQGPTGEAGIYLRSVAAGGAVRLSQDASDNTPAMSPDGQSIAFRSARDNSPGIFVMNRRGESVRRLTNGGSDPAWTPDGREIVYSGEWGGNPDVRQAPSELWAVNVASGQRRRVAEADAVQPRVAPDGRFVAFWGLPVDAGGGEFSGANRDVWVQPLAGGLPIPIAPGESTDWNPVWAPDGRTLYFSSDRGGTMNIWQIAVDPKTGRPSGEPQPVTAPTVYAGEMSVGGDGTIAYAAYDFSTLVRSVGFDPVAGLVTDAPRDIVTGQRAWLHPDVSRDGRLLALRSFKSQEDIWIVGVDGDGLRPITNDAPLDRGPRWAPDGSLLFYSARNGRFQAWTMRPDGSGMRQLTHGSSIVNDPVPSRDGRWVGGSNPNTGEQFIFDAHDWTQPPERLPSPPTKSPVYLRDWSPDGTRIAAADTSGVLWVFDVTARSWERIGAGVWPRWLPDGRRLIATSRARLMLVDTTTRVSREIYREESRLVGAAVLAPDGRRLYFTSTAIDSDIWTMRFTR